MMNNTLCVFTYTCLLLSVILAIADSFKVKQTALYAREHLGGQNNTLRLDELVESKKTVDDNHDDDAYDDDVQQMWSTYIQNMIDRFYHQREDGRQQFGFILLARPEDQLNVQLYPHDANNDPIVDNTFALSPNHPDNYVNYVAARPDFVPELRDSIHSENNILGVLDNLWDRYIYFFHRPPTFILLYSWIMPCPDCTQLILNYFQDLPYANVLQRMVVYTTEGLRLPYMSERGNEESRNRMREAGIGVINHECWTLPPGSLLSDETKDISADNVNEFSIITTVGGPYALEQCLVSETVQGCLYHCLDDSTSCCSKKSHAKSMLATYINQFMSDCGDKNMEKCADNWINDKIGNACGCIRHSELQNKLKECSKKCKALPMSMPLKPYGPTIFNDILQHMYQLKDFPQSSVECKDNRTEGLLCSQYNASRLTAGNSLCRLDSECGYHGKKYSWCYTDDDWGYCCTGACSYKDQEKYLSCKSGNEWQYCGNAGTINIDGKRCSSVSPCGLHLDVESESYYWCYIDKYKNWQYCCQPKMACGKNGQTYNWCYTGYEKKTHWEKCIKNKTHT